jgi:hypothetical protein
MHAKRREGKFISEKGANIDIHVILSGANKNFINFRGIFFAFAYFILMYYLPFADGKAIFISSFFTLSPSIHVARNIK